MGSSGSVREDLRAAQGYFSQRRGCCCKTCESGTKPTAPTTRAISAEGSASVALAAEMTNSVLPDQMAEYFRLWLALFVGSNEGSSPTEIALAIIERYGRN